MTSIYAREVAGCAELCGGFYSLEKKEKRRDEKQLQSTLDLRLLYLFIYFCRWSLVDVGVSQQLQTFSIVKNEMRCTLNKQHHQQR